MTLNAIPTAHASHDEHAANQGSPADASSSLDLHRTTSDMRTTRSRLGLQPQAPIVEEHDLAEQQDWWWAKVRIALREPFAEFFGTMILVLFGDGAVAQVLLSTGQKSAPGGNGFGNYQSINWGWALGVMLGIYVAGQSLPERLVGCRDQVHGAELENRRFRRIPQSCHHIYQLRPSQAPVATVPHIPAGAIPWRLRCLYVYSCMIPNHYPPRPLIPRTNQPALSTATTLTALTRSNPRPP